MMGANRSIIFFTGHRKNILKKAVKAGRVKYVFLAENADPAVTEPLEELCTANHIQITWVHTMAELGRACGIEVGAAAAAVVN